jgi:hypothetical protein
LREGRVVVGVGNIALWRWGVSYWKRLRGLVLEVDDAILTFGVVTSVGRAYAVVVRSTMARVRVRVRREGKGDAFLKEWVVWRSVVMVVMIVMVDVWVEESVVVNNE